MKHKSNIDLRNAMKLAGVFQWECAEKFGLNEGNFCRLLRKELPVSTKEIILGIIREVKKEMTKID